MTSLGGQTRLSCRVPAALPLGGRLTGATETSLIPLSTLWIRRKGPLLQRSDQAAQLRLAVAQPCQRPRHTFVQTKLAVQELLVYMALLLKCIPRTHPEGAGWSRLPWASVVRRCIGRATSGWTRHVRPLGAF